MNINYIIVLMKYSADVDCIPEDAWDKEKGTLIRSRLKLISNPLDDKALGLALKLKSHFKCPVHALSMGPPSAEEICRRAIAYGADSASLLTDAAFAGSDTLATSHTIKACIDWIISKKSLSDILVLSGMQSPDGDTAQVPVQTASLLGYQILPYICDFEYSAENGLVFECLAPFGRNRYKLLKTPIVGTVTAYAPPLPDFVSFEDILRASSSMVEIISDRELRLGKTKTGLSGSWTRVIKIFSSGKKNRSCKKINLTSKSDRVGELHDLFRELQDFAKRGYEDQNRKSENTTDSSSIAPPGLSFYKGDFIVISETDADGAISRGTLELLGQAKILSEKLTAKSAVLIANGSLSEKEKIILASAGADKIICINGDYNITAIVQAIRQINPQAVFIPATMTGRITAPLLAAELSAGLTADCTGLEINNFELQSKGSVEKYNMILLQTRPALGGNIMACIVSLRGKENSSPQMASVRPGVFPILNFDNTTPEISSITPSSAGWDSNVELVGKSSHAAVDSNCGNIIDCDVLISVGQGIRDRDSVAKFAEPLAEAIRKKWKLEVGISCSRAAVEAGIMEYPHQVGQTGKNVRPKLYFALGISGAIQHYAGMENSGKIIAINNDPDAQIANFADYFLQGDISEVIPRIHEVL